MPAFPIKDGRVVVIRKAEPSDLDRIMANLETVAKEGRWIATEEVTPERRERFQKALTGDQLHLVALVNEQMAGGLDLAPYFGGLKKARHVMGLGMLILDGYRGLGIGTALMEEAIRWARSIGLMKISLSVFSNNEAAIRLYQKSGFVEEGCLKRQFKIMGNYVDEVAMGRWLA